MQAPEHRRAVTLSHSDTQPKSHRLRATAPTSCRHMSTVMQSLFRAQTHNSWVTGSKPQPKLPARHETKDTSLSCTSLQNVKPAACQTRRKKGSC
eukprot:scaffold139859_cov21-Tisochrysis_lutea.AAC.1